MGELMKTRLVRVGMTLEEVVTGCYTKYEDAKAIVQGKQPSKYSGTLGAVQQRTTSAVKSACYMIVSVPTARLAQGDRIWWSVIEIELLYQG